MPGNYDGRGVNPSGGNRTPFPKGEYDLRIISAEAGYTKNNDQKVTVNFKVADGPYAGREIRYHTVTFLSKESAGAGMTLHFLKCIGEPFEGEFAWDEARWVGRLLRANVGIEPDNQGREWNRVVDILDTPESMKVKNAAHAAAPVEVPF